MSHRNLIVAGIVLLALAGSFWHQINERRKLERVMRDFGSVPLGSAIFSSIASVDMSGPKLDWLATLDGDVTTLTFTVSNRTTGTYKDIVFSGFALAKIDPREGATLLIKIAALAPGESQKFVLHYDHLKWLGDDVLADRIDLGWAQKPMDLATSWTTAQAPSTLPTDPHVTVNASDAKGSNSTTGIPIDLDEKDARALKARRDAALKARSLDGPVETVQPLSVRGPQCVVDFPTMNHEAARDIARPSNP